MREESTDGRTGMDNAKTFSEEGYPKPQDDYSPTGPKSDPMVEALEDENPLPKPKTGESQNEFVGRCMQKLSDENSSLDKDQRLAACYEKFRR